MYYLEYFLYKNVVEEIGSGKITSVNCSSFSVATSKAFLDDSDFRSWQSSTVILFFKSCALSWQRNSVSIIGLILRLYQFFLFVIFLLSHTTGDRGREGKSNVFRVKNPTNYCLIKKGL